MTLTTKLLGASAAIWLGAMTVGGAAAITPLPIEETEPVRYDADGKLLRPEYREWVFLGAGLDMTYGSRAANAEPDHHMFTNVFVNPASYRAFVGTGRWPDKTIFMLEVRHTGTDRRPNRAGLFQAEAVGLEAHVLDAAKGGSRFYDFDGKSAGSPLSATSSCNACHTEHGAVDNTFVQFYPELLTVAKAKGTIKPGFDLEATHKP
ncbi:MAG: cytochrome P460 family protein [Vicinamibacteraceae bacterium]